MDNSILLLLFDFDDFYQSFEATFKTKLLNLALCNNTANHS